MIGGQLKLLLKASHLIAFAWLLSNAFTVWQIQPLVEQSVAFYTAMPETVKAPYVEAINSPNFDQANADLKMAGYAPLQKAEAQAPELTPQFVTLFNQAKGLFSEAKAKTEELADAGRPTLP
jgi:hypothetical protein